MGFAHPIALLWDSLQPGVQTQLSFVIIRETGVISGLGFFSQGGVLAVKPMYFGL